ncbi:MAG: HAMP domain-containing protein [Myxococcales bacterium]|nr:HAMP domain-containing protein [Myxococcales bacterium]
MKLRGRFIVTLSLAALVPIGVAAVVTREVVARGLRQDYQEDRRNVEQGIGRELSRLSTQVAEAVQSVASANNWLVGGLLRELATRGRVEAAYQRVLREQGRSVMRGLSLDVLAITGAFDEVLVSPHFRAATGEPDAGVATLARATAGKPLFARDKVMAQATVETVLVAKAALIVRDGEHSLAVAAGRRLGDELLSAVRRSGRVDARVIAPDGAVLLPGSSQWQALAKEPSIRVPLAGADGQPVAFVEAVVSDGDLDRVLRNVTLVSAVLAVLALGVVVLIGFFVARALARDLDQLVQGSLAAARGDLDHRVQVRAKDEVGAVANAFNFMMEDLRAAKDRLVIAERIAAWQEIARRLAHEIKNPLTPIQMAMDTLRKTWKKQHPSFDEILEESTSTVLEEVDRLKRIVTEFSDFARMPKPEFGRVDVNEAVTSSLALYVGAAPLEIRTAPGLPAIDADRRQLSQVLLNLVENARDAIAQRPDPEHGKITVLTRAGDAGDRVEIIVEDNGPGVPAERKDKVFSPYFTTKEHKGGTGLGLAIVHRIVSDHGGRIALGNVLGGGARFTVELPLRNGAALLVSRI